MKKKTIAIIAAAIIVAAAVGGAIAIANMNKNNDSSEISIVDGSGKTVTISEPLSNVAVINSNVPKTMVMLGISDTISCYYYASNTFDIKAEELAKTETDRNLGTYYTPSVETLLKYHIQAVICPVTSMTIYSSVEKQCNEVGIKVVRLNCNGTNMIEDVKKISILFGEPESAKKVIDEYEESFNATISAIEKALGDKKDYSFIAVMTTRNAIYNHTSDLSQLYLNLFKKNFTVDTDLSTTGVTNTINDNLIELVAEKDPSITIGLFRCASGGETQSDFTDTYNYLVGSNKLLSTSASIVKENKIYVINSELMSGLYSHIGLLILLKCVYEIDVEGYTDFNGMIHDFQEKYKQNVISNNEVLISQYGKDMPTGGNTVKYTVP